MAWMLCTGHDTLGDSPDDVWSMTGAPSNSDLAAVADDVIPTEMIARLNGYALTKAKHRGQIESSGGELKDSPTERRSELVWLDNSPAHADIYKLLAGFVRQVNDDFFRLELVGFSEMLQLATYRSEDHGFYDWHLDIGARERTK